VRGFLHSSFLKGSLAIAQYPTDGVTLQYSVPNCQFRYVIIALTASAFEEQRASILAAGCDDFVRKPFREQVIFEKMAEYLGVQYAYEQNTDSQGIQEQTSRGDRKNLTSDDLAVMPADWVTQLHQASLEVDADRILQLIEQIPATHLALAEGLTDLVRRFCFDEILELSE
jgi:two-component system sensor histidine kinase/response regulator